MSLESPSIPNPTLDSSPSTPPHNRYCCFHFPCFGPSPTPTLTLGGPSSSSVSSTSSFWDRVRLAESDSTWWTRPITAFKKAREWSEIVAGPKWKTFIRRFNRNSRHRHGHAQGHGKFQYDPLSYALNFDDGQGQNGHFDEEGFGDNYPDFSTRFVGRGSVDFGQGAPAS